MKEYFGVLFEFDRGKVNHIIERSVEANLKGYVCVVDGNVLATSARISEYRNILNGALVNTCDGSSIAKLAGSIHKEKLETYKGPELFNHFVREKYKQLFLGNTTEVLAKMRHKLIKNGADIGLMQFNPLPFRNVDEFDYKDIAHTINEFSPQIVWISLGAPRQEIFMSRLFPFLNNCVVFTVGAAFNFYINDKENRRAPKWIRDLNLEWLFRIFRQPRKAGKRAMKYLIALPGLILKETRKVRKRIPSLT